MDNPLKNFTELRHSNYNFLRIVGTITNQGKMSLATLEFKNIGISTVCQRCFFYSKYRYRVTLPCDAPHAFTLSLSYLLPINHKKLILAIFKTTEQH